MTALIGWEQIIRIMTINADQSPDSKPRELLEKDITRQIIGAFYAIYNDLRHGLLESAYAGALEVELEERAVPFVRECPLDVFYHGRVVAMYRADFLVAGRVLVEVKSSRVLSDADHRQLLNYLRATKIKVGLLLHFGPEAKFHRMVNE